MTDSPFENLAAPAKAREPLHGSLVFKPIREVRRLIFIATPHCGIPLAWGPIKEMATRLVRLPTLLQRPHASLLASNCPDAFTRTFRQGSATSIDRLAWEHPLLLAIDNLPIDPDVRRHSIIAKLCGTVRPGGGDGQVPFSSAHHPGTVSDLIVHAGHDYLEGPKVIEEVSLILKEHATHCPHGQERTGAIVPANLAIAPPKKFNPSSWSERP